MKTSVTHCNQNNAPAEQTVTLTVGTAGHIDHGKTALVTLLTGCDCDTMPEEKARGMTIDLGFASCRLPDNRRIGIVDVPGHERFIHNMVAGAAGIDIVLLVIAADDGIMPQTLEHFHIVRLLGIASGMVALTKIDLVAPERIDEMTRQIRELVAGSFLEGCPIVPVSPKTGLGFDAFYEAFVAAIDKTVRRDSSGAFRMHVESSFVMPGIGTIVSGIPRCGTVRVGDTLDLLPGAGEKKVRGLQVYGADAAEGKAGECVALRLSDLSHADVKRGMVLATAGYFTPTAIVDAHLQLMPNLVRPLKPRSGIRFHVGTAEVTGYMALPELTPPAPGSEVYVQFQLDKPVVATPGDFFVVRSLSPVQTLGGGNVISQETVKMRRSRGNWVQTVKEREKAYRDPGSALNYALQKGGAVPQHIEDLAKTAGLSLESTREQIQALVQQGQASALPGERYVTAAALTGVGDEFLVMLGRRHDAAPLSMGFAKKDLFRDLKSERLLIDQAIEQLLKSGRITSNAAGFQIPERMPKLSPQQAGLANKIRDIYHKSGFASPRRDELPQLLGAPANMLDPVFDFLAQTGELMALSDKVVLSREHLAESKTKLMEHLTRHGYVETGVFKDILKTTRKYAIPLLEYWDSQGLTRRVGNNRYLKE
ncbi:MAG: selenocysteine-specific translation elongation factor [Verrucomicrobia bacterium]|nr:selenocysteine-specific translation elongation factor [Verrucomicrobiota bacterium]MCG2678583.1 selenocysteine-specific translation elongation factor [Kiritimatiellia bacterium]MBU4248480.1 selenocysteine-specific translation elongation factor [Verrucomicrobiota bacterium]MBU4291577.1 selenocysteine-specific translation elongation factor [Verrucomicrobiota bacterium]MBU4428070.1 selenocysteine-specific translation elongation factor [Verrucomicrobiota bacterium]